MERYKELEEKEIFRNEHISVYSKKLQLPNDKIVNWTFTSKKSAVGVVAILPDNTVLMVRQYRPAIKEETLELPAGLLEDDEEPIIAAIRELEEETGYRGSNLKKLYEFYNSPGVSAGKFYLYYTEDLVKTHQHLDEDEFVNVEKIPLEKISIDMLTDAKSILGIQYAKEKRGIK